MPMTKKLLLLAGAALAAGLLLAGDRAEADRPVGAEPVKADPGDVTVLDACDRQAGSLFVRDTETNICEHLFGTNPDWRVFSWNDRGDVFVNDGNTHNSCIWDAGFCQGTARHLLRGANTNWRNVVSSNSWTTGLLCLRGC